MAINRKKTVHVHSSVPNKQPLASVLEVGELAVNNAAGNEFISTKNTDDEVVRFSSDNKMVSIIEKKTVMPYKGEVLEPTEQDLLDNKSQIVIGLNQVAASDTAGYDQVNGATDMHGDEINPSEDGGKTNGAGFAINMDRYAMIGANPSFSSVTVSEIKSDDELFIGNNKELEESIPMPEISVYGSSVKIHANDGKVGITAKDDVNISGEHDGNFNVENDMCIGAGNEMKIGAVEKLTIGEDCSGTETGVVEIKGGEIIINREATSNLSATTVEGALEELAEKIAAAGDGYITGGHVDSGTGIINVDVLEHPSGATIDGLEEYINNRLGDISGIAKRSEVTKETIDEVPKIVISFFDKDDNELEDLEIVLDDYYNKGEIDDMELVIAAALNDLNDRLLVVSGDVTNLKIDVEELKNKKDNFVTDGNVDEGTGIIYLNRSESDEPAEVTGLSEYITSKVGSLSGDTFVSSGYVNTNTGIIKLIRNDGTEVTPISGLPEYVNGQTDGLVKDVEYTTSGGTKVIVFKDKDGDVVRIIDATEFIKDGMVDSVSIGVPTSGQHAGEDCLIITWNTYAGKDTTEIPLSMFFDSEDYYTKDEVNTMLGENFALDLYSGDSFSSITQVILKDELVTSAALNELNSRVVELDNIKLDKTDDSYVEGGHVDSGNGIINLSVKNKGNVEVDGLAEYLDGKISEVSGDTNNFVTGGSVDSGTGIITLVVPGKNDAPVSGLSEYITNRLSNFNTNAYEIYDMTNISMSILSQNPDGHISSAVTNSTAVYDAINTIWEKGVIPVANIVLPGETGSIQIPLTKSSKNTNMFYGSESQQINEFGDGEGSSIMEHLVIEKKNTTTEIKALANDSDTEKYVHSTGDTMTGALLVKESASSSNVGITIDAANGISSVNGFIHTEIPSSEVKNNYVLLAGGGYKSISELATEVASGDGNTYVVSGTLNNNQELVLCRTDGQDIEVSLSALDHDDFVKSGSVEDNGDITLRTHSGRTATVTGLSDYVSSMLDGNDYVVSGFVASNGDITLNMHSGGTAPVTGLSQYVSSVTQNFITAAQDKYVSAGTVGDDGVITLNLRHGGTAQVTGLETYVNGKLDGNDYVVSGSVASNGDITLNMHSGGTAPVTGLAQYVAEHSATGDWVDVSGDTMTGKLTMSGASISFADGADEVIISSPDSENIVISSTSDDVHVTVNGDVTSTGAMYSSDKRLKENIKFISDDDLESAKKIDFKEFNFISDKDSQKVGVIAQELKENGLGKFTRQNDAGYLTVDYISLLCLKIAELEKEIKELKEGK